MATETETNQKENRERNFTSFEEDQEQSEEDTEISNIDSDESFNKNNFSVIQHISSTLNDFINENESENNENNSFNYDDSIFFCKKIPTVSIEDYLNRIQKYSKFEDSTLIFALIYIDRLLEKKNIKLSKHNVYKILLTAVLIAIKYNEDEIYDNFIFAKIFGIKREELNKLEDNFLDLIEFELFISKKEFQLYYNKI